MKRPVAKIFYSMSGEGRGHAARVRTMVERLRPEHEMVLLAPDQAYDFLAPIYNNNAETPNVEVRRIPGLRFYYTRGRLDLSKSICCGFGFLAKLNGFAREMAETIRREEPNLVITDFEPILPKAASKTGVPVVSLNHQDFLLAYDLSTLPKTLQWYAWMMSFVVKAHHVDHAETIVSSFFTSPLRPGWENVTQVGPLLRKELEEAKTSEGGYILSYVRRSMPPQAIELLKTCDREVRVYGLGKQPDQGNLRFFDISEDGFVRDLAGCDAMIGAAGNQSLGEAIYLGKPVLALPEESHHEQMINSHFLRQMGVGDWSTIESFSKKHLASFMERLSQFRANLATFRGQINGNPTALAAIQRHLPA